MPPIRFGAGG
jgi:hypothetical protein